MLAQFEEGNLLSESHNGTESGDKSDESLTLTLLISEVKMDKMSSGDESDTEPILTDILEDIFDISQSHTRINMREVL